MYFCMLNNVFSYCSVFFLFFTAGDEGANCHAELEYGMELKPVTKVTEKQDWMSAYKMDPLHHHKNILFNSFTMFSHSWPLSSLFAIVFSFGLVWHNEQLSGLVAKGLFISYEAEQPYQLGWYCIWTTLSQEKSRPWLNFLHHQPNIFQPYDIISWINVSPSYQIKMKAYMLATEDQLISIHKKITFIVQSNKMFANRRETIWFKVRDNFPNVILA